MATEATTQPTYSANRLLDILAGKMQLKNDAALARMLEIAPVVLTKIRRHRLPIGASLLIRMHELTGMPIRDLRDLMGDRRVKYRLVADTWTDAERASRIARQSRNEEAVQPESGTAPDKPAPRPLARP